MHGGRVRVPSIIGEPPLHPLDRSTHDSNPNPSNAPEGRVPRTPSACAAAAAAARRPASYWCPAAATAGPPSWRRQMPTTMRRRGSRRPLGRPLAAAAAPAAGAGGAASVPGRRPAVGWTLCVGDVDGSQNVRRPIDGTAALNLPQRRTRRQGVSWRVCVQPRRLLGKIDIRGGQIPGICGACDIIWRHHRIVSWP